MITLENVTKFYRYKGFRHYVFKDLNLVIPSGKNVGILGPNGAGKSTLLRLLGGFEAPNSGKITTNKLISFPVGLGSSFVGLLSARENVKFVCRIYGKSLKEMNEIVEYVQNFAEIGEYFDLPIKTYSSGMKGRIQFGLSMAFDFDYYLVDETLAVGDQTFNNKAKKIFEEKRKNASTLLVSHSMSKLKENCEIGIYLNKQTVQFFEKIDDAISVYIRDYPPSSSKKKV